MDRQKIAYYCDWISSLLSIVLLLTVIIGWMPLVFAVLFLRSAIQKFFFPAEHAMIQGILKSEDYTTAAGLNQVVMSLFMLFGNGLGIFVYWTVGVYGAIMTDALTFIISALLIRSCRIPEEVRLPNGGHKLKDLNIALVFKDFNHGMKYILHHKLLSALLVGFFVFGVVNGGFSVMPIFMLKYKLEPHAYEEYSVLLGITFGIGVLIGSFAASLLLKNSNFINDHWRIIIIRKLHHCCLFCRKHVHFPFFIICCSIWPSFSEHCHWRLDAKHC